MKRFLCGLMALGVLVGGAREAKAQYIFTTLDFGVALGINDSGQIVGASALGGFLYSAGTYTPVLVPPSAIPWGINNSGQLVGFYYGTDHNEHGFLLSGGSYTTLDVPLSNVGSTAAYGINGSGQIVGGYQSSGVPHGFLLSAGTYSMIDFPGAGGDATALGINAAGQIVGGYADALGGGHGFLRVTAITQGLTRLDRPRLLPMVSTT